jgi:hypothetical protein
MENRSDYPHTKTRETTPRANILSLNKPLNHHIQSLRKVSLKETPPNGGKKNQLIPNHQFGFRQRHSMIEQSHRIVQRKNEDTERKQCCTCSIIRHHPSIQQSMAHWITVHAKTTSPFELLYP